MLCENISMHTEVLTPFTSYGELPLAQSLDLLATETIDEDQVKWLADEMETVVGDLGMLEWEKRMH
jgi:hypothetical protein